MPLVPLCLGRMELFVLWTTATGLFGVSEDTAHGDVCELSTGGFGLEPPFSGWDFCTALCATSADVNKYIGLIDRMAKMRGKRRIMG